MGFGKLRCPSPGNLEDAMRLSSVEIALIVALSAVPVIAAEPTRAAGADEGFVIREALRAQPVALSVLTDGLVTEGPAAQPRKDRGLAGWPKRDSGAEIHDAPDETTNPRERKSAVGGKRG